MIANDLGTCGWLVDELANARIVDRERLEPYLEDFTAECPYADADAFAKHLAREGVLSKYQAHRAIDGEARKLILGAYLLVEVIGNGSLGPVFRARGRADQKSYALKVLPQRAWNVRLARSQVRIFEQLPSHDTIVPFIDVGAAHNLHYFVWPYVEGRTLENIIHECGPLSPGEVARIGVRLAEALSIGHSRGLLHGLIKPSNVLIAPDGQARLLDFGLGALLADNSDEDPLVDTVSRASALARILECASPESIADSSKWTPIADQYSLGCTLYFASAGRYPFPGGNFVDKIVHHQLHKPTPIRSLNPDIPHALADVIDRLMQKMPSDRYRRLDELIGEIAPLATASRVHEPVPVNIQTPPPRARLVVATPTSMPMAEPIVVEPPLFDLSGEPVRRGLMGRLFSAAAVDEMLHATLVAAGPVEAGSEVILHVYIHGAKEGVRLTEAIHACEEQPRVLGTVSTKRVITTGTRIGLHLGVTGAMMAEPLQEFDRADEALCCRFLLSIPADTKKKPLPGRLMIGQDGKLIGQIDFVLPVVERPRS